MEDITDEFLSHFGVKGMKWGVRKDERPLSIGDQALNMSQRSQVKIASAVSALAAVGLASNAAATAFQLQNRWEHLKIAEAGVQYLDKMSNNPLVDEATRQAARSAKDKMIQGIIGSAVATTAISAAIGIVTHRTAKAYFAPLHKVYGDAKPKINREIRQLGKEIKAGKHPKLTDKAYHTKVSQIVEKHMTKDANNVLQPFRELARSQLGTELNTKQLKIKFEKLPNTDLMHKMTITTPNGLKLVKGVRNVKHSGLPVEGEQIPDLDLYFDYKFDKDGFIEEWSSPTIELAAELLDDKLDLSSAIAKYSASKDLEHSEEFLAHFGVKGMKWGVRKDPGAKASAGAIRPDRAQAKARAVAAGKVALRVAKVSAIPIATATGIGVPLGIGLGISIRALNEPEVQQAIASAASYSKEVLKDVGQTSMSKIKELGNPFSTQTTDGSGRIYKIPSGVPGANGLVLNPNPNGMDFVTPKAARDYLLSR